MSLAISPATPQLHGGRAETDATCITAPSARHLGDSTATQRRGKRPHEKEATLHRNAAETETRPKQETENSELLDLNLGQLRKVRLQEIHIPKLALVHLSRTLDRFLAQRLSDTVLNMTRLLLQFILLPCLRLSSLPPS
ncbi:hypothetical protein E2C01_100184 [Portunus trituberculatus]|uniref:Uncharacterized protein n=1 Tax=Portunus trituberculatus TaxID=210409 RepID=A0A5B7K634_PORTR|nr:hypothetical protein [Portunus trituberculatus]